MEWFKINVGMVKLLLIIVVSYVMLFFGLMFFLYYFCLNCCFSWYIFYFLSVVFSLLFKNFCLLLIYLEIVNFVYWKKYGSNIGFYKMRKIIIIVIGINVVKNIVWWDFFFLVFVFFILGLLIFKMMRKYIKNEMFLCVWIVWFELIVDWGIGDE